MIKMPEIHVEDYLGRKTLILGDVNAGKTTLTRKVLEALLCRRELGARIAIVDMAPDIPEKLATEKGLVGVGGKLTPPEGHGILYLGGHFEPPRLSSKTEDEALEKARQNRRSSERLFRKINLTRDILFVNEVSIYLQAGTTENMIRWLDRSTTVIVNGYWGERLGGGALSKRERTETAKLKTYFEQNGRVLILEPCLQLAP